MKARRTKKRPIRVEQKPISTVVRQTLEKLPLDQIARKSGFVQRIPRKLQPRALVQAACQLTLQQSVSLRDWAILIGLASATLISKQDLSKRFTSRAVSYMAQVLQALLQDLFRPPRPLPAEALAPFKRAIAQDSTSARVHPMLASSVPGGTQPARAAGWATQ